jgi:glycosyltransferase involved in cell wall biosynthesis
MYKLFQLASSSDQVLKTKDIKLADNNARLINSGDAIYGPYITMEKGDYCLELDLEFNRAINSYIDIISDHAKKTHARIPLAQLPANNNRLQFTLTEKTHDIEFRLFCYDSGVIITLRSYTVYSEQPIYFSTPRISSLNNVLPIFGDNYDYSSATDDPQVMLSADSIKSEYIILEMVIESDADIGVCDIFSISNERYSEHLAQPYVSGQKITFIIKNDEIGSIRLDPADRSGVRFSITDLTMKYVAEMDTNLYIKAISDLRSLYKFNDLAEDNPAGSMYKGLLNKAVAYTRNNRDYIRWMRNIESIWLKDRENKSYPKEISDPPMFSVIMPVYNSDIAWLAEAIDSVLSQTYGNFELILVNDGSTNPNVLEFLHGCILKDNRLILLDRNSNGGISVTTLNGINSAKGQYVCFMDHDDLISPHALGVYFDKISRNPNIELLYSDEDFIDECGNRFNPHFKSDFNLELLLSMNYITHFVCAKRSSLDGWAPTKAVDGAQDYHLLLHLAAKVDESNIAHIDKILYHWRAHDLSTAKNSGIKKYTIEAGKVAIESYLDKMNIQATVHHSHIHHFYRVKYTPQAKPLVSIIIPTKDHPELLRTCIESIITQTTYDNYEMVVIDNQSTDKDALKYLKFIANLPNVRVIGYWDIFNWSAINNFAAKEAKGDIFLFLNNDTEVMEEGWLQEIVSQLQRPRVGIVGAKLLYPDHTVQHAGVILGLGGGAAHAFMGIEDTNPGYYGRANLTQRLSAVTGACLAVNKDVFESVGGFNEDLQVAYNDIEFCVRVGKTGYKIVYAAHARLIHYESKSRGYDHGSEKSRRLHKEIRYFLSLHPNDILADPFYNSNLSKDNDRFEIRHK